jgi:hypothetical protein
MWQAYVDFIEWMMGEEDPDDPWSLHSVDAQDLAIVILFLASFTVVMWSWFCIACVT